MKARSALIVGSAPTEDRAEHYARLIRGSELLIAADGGADLCLRSGRVPDVCVGDFDSTSEETLAAVTDLGSEIRRFPTVKDVSDLDLAIDVARERSAVNVMVIAAFSGRLDHTLAALGTLARAADLHAVADEGAWVAYAMCAESLGSLALTESPGTVVSLMAIDGDAIVSITGVAYPLDRGRLPALSSRGLSNVATELVQRIAVHTGRAIVIVDRITQTLPLQ